MKEKSAGLAKTGLVEQSANQIVMKRPVLNESDVDEVMKNVNLLNENAQTNVKGQMNEEDLEKAHQSADLLQCGVAIHLDIDLLKEEGNRPKGVLNLQTGDPAQQTEDLDLWTDDPAPRTTDDPPHPIGAPSLLSDLKDAGLLNEGVPLKENAPLKENVPLNVDALPIDKDLLKQDAPPKDKEHRKEDALLKDSGRQLEEGVEKKDKVQTRGLT